MKQPGRCAIILSAIVGVAAIGEDSGAPLASTRQELRKLESDQKVKPGAPAPDNANLDLPAFHLTEESGPSPYQMAKSLELEKERKLRKESQKNWLVNGVEKLAQTDAEKDSTHSDNPPKAPIDSAPKQQQGSADPEFLLNTFNEQKKRSDAKQAESKSPRVPPADPFAPFLQDWLGSSPVRGQVFESLDRKSNDNASTISPGSGMGGGAGTNSPDSSIIQADRGAREDVSRKPNPYLIESSGPTQKEIAGVSGSLPSAFNPASSLNQPMNQTTLTPVLDSRDEAQQPSRKPLLPALSDEKKYFPQLKKF